MSSFFDMLTALIALIISAAFLHFGGGEKTNAPDPASASPSQQETVMPSDNHAASKNDDQRS
ncbi:hypothetical protein MMA231_01019 [Asticcacaulis sp. MM231]|uniref:hypothetical protein n=1 Tax=Asticcacaulis sp. MM231 TaxID=3157666 RepID=UPI0032D58CC8